VLLLHLKLLFFIQYFLFWWA